MPSAAMLLREARRTAGLTQTEFARRAGVAQSVISAYENAKRQPSFATLQRLIEATGSTLEVAVAPRSTAPLLDAVRAHRLELRERLSALGAVDIRVFGSVARGEETALSDIDLLVELGSDVGAFALLQMQSAAESILGRHVDVVPAAGLKPDTVERVMREAVPL